MEIGEILKCDEINKLYEEKVNLTNKIGSLHRQVTLSRGEEADMTDHKAELTTCYAVMEGLDHRLEELNDVLKQTRDEESRIRYNFMKIAKTVLTAETYQKIRGLSDNSLRDVKPMFKELRQHKLAS